MRRAPAFRTIAIATLVLFAAGPTVPGMEGSGTGLRWEKDMKSARARALSEGKLVMVDFWASWCKFCDKLDETTYRDKTVVARLSRTTVPVKVNTEGRPDELELADEHGVEGLPTIGFFTPEGRAVARIQGYVDAAKFLKLLNTAEIEGADMTAWERTLRKNPKDFTALFGLGSKMYALNYHDDARPLLEAARRIDTGTLRERKRVRMMLARIVESQSGFADSEALLREGLALPAESDSDPRLSFLLSRCLASQGNGVEARKVLTKLIATYPKHPIIPTAKKTLEGMR